MKGPLHEPRNVRTMTDTGTLLQAARADDLATQLSWRNPCPDGPAAGPRLPRGPPQRGDAARLTQPGRCGWLAHGAPMVEIAARDAPPSPGHSRRRGTRHRPCGLAADHARPARSKTCPDTAHLPRAAAPTASAGGPCGRHRARAAPVVGQPAPWPGRARRRHTTARPAGPAPDGHAHRGRPACRHLRGTGSGFGRARTRRRDRGVRGRPCRSRHGHADRARGAAHIQRRRRGGRAGGSGFGGADRRIVPAPGDTHRGRTARGIAAWFARRKTDRARR